MTLLRSLVGLALGATLACDVHQDPTPPITITLSKTSVSMVPGLRGPGPGRLDAFVDVVLIVHRNGFTGPVTVSVQKPGSPATLVVEPIVEDTSGVIRVSAGAGTPSGLYRATVRATAGSEGSVSASLEILVRAFRMQVHATSVVVSQGATNTVAVHLQRAGDTPVSVKAASTAPGVTITPSMPQPGVSYIDISALPNAPTGVHRLTIDAGSDTEREIRQIELVVQAPRPRRQIAFRWCRYQSFVDHPNGFAYANDGEAWSRVEPDAEGVIRFEATDRLRFAEFSSVRDFYSYGGRTRVLHLTSDELESMQCAPAAFGTRAFAVDARDAESYLVAFGRWRRTSASQYSIDGARPGLHDLIATGTRSVATGTEHRGIVQRSVDPPNGDTIVIEFAGTASVVLDSAGVTTDVPVDFGSTLMHTNTTVSRLVSIPAENRYWAFPESVLLPTDIQSLMSRAGFRGVLHYFRKAADVQLSFGPDVAEPRVDADAQTITLPVQSQYPDFAGVGQQYVVDYRGIYDRTELWTSRAYVGTAASEWVFTPPDLGRVGWVRPFDASDVAATAVSGPAGLFFGGTPAPGTTIKWAGKLALPYPNGY